MERPEWKDAPTKYKKDRTLPLKWIILHHSGGHKAGDLLTLQGLTNKKVSADFYIDKKGQIYKLNPQLGIYYTYHAGKSKLGKYTDLNRYSIGIEMEHMPSEGWPTAQLESVSKLVAWMLEAPYISGALEHDYIHGHREVAYPPGRKTDPESFPWSRFFELVTNYRAKS